MRRGLRRPLLLALGVVAVAGLALSFPLFVFPRTEPPGRADAVVVFADGRARRIATGARLVAEGVAPVLVISDGGGADSLEARACRRGVGVPAVCVTPEEGTTEGEVRAFAGLAAERGWRSLVLVTSRHHLRRASLLMDQCYDGRTFTVRAAEADLAVDEWLPRVLHEWAGLAAAVTAQRAC
jgi:uncharacterized SAM-binding protein YcdF (DUF218 family)